MILNYIIVEEEIKDFKFKNIFEKNKILIKIFNLDNNNYENFAELNNNIIKIYDIEFQITKDKNKYKFSLNNTQNPFIFIYNNTFCLINNKNNIYELKYFYNNCFIFLDKNNEQISLKFENNIFAHNNDIEIDNLLNNLNNNHIFKFYKIKGNLKEILEEKIINKNDNDYIKYILYLILFISIIILYKKKLKIIKKSKIIKKIIRLINKK